jgi:hypothetical protein
VRALTFHGRQSIAVDSVPDAAIQQPTDAIVRVGLAGICGSDLHVYHERERGLDPGTVMGHEFVGEIVDVGPGVRDLVKGQRVLSPFSTSCSDCFYCAKGLTARCTSGQLYGWVQNGAGLQGTQAEYVRVPLAATTLVPIPPGVDDEEGLLLGDVFATGYYCASLAAVAPGGCYVVLGCGSARASSERSTSSPSIRSRSGGTTPRASAPRRSRSRTPPRPCAKRRMAAGPTPCSKPWAALRRNGSRSTSYGRAGRSPRSACTRKASRSRPRRLTTRT